MGEIIRKFIRLFNYKTFKMLNIIMFGAPGAGKGTQAIKIAEKYQLIHTSTGDILRAEIGNKSELGMKAKTFMDKGELVPDAVLIDIIRSVMERNKTAKGLVLDGFPRTLVQAEELDKMLNANHTPVSLVIALETKDEELVTRLLKRALETGRADDKEDVIKQRLQVYKNQTEPLIAYYKKQNKFHPVHGIGSIEGIFADICKEIDNLISC